MDMKTLMGWLGGLLRPSTIVTVVIISGTVLAIVPLVHYIGPSLAPSDLSTRGEKLA